MKKLFTLALILISAFCFGQTGLKISEMPLYDPGSGPISGGFFPGIIGNTNRKIPLSILNTTVTVDTSVLGITGNRFTVNRRVIARQDTNNVFLKSSVFHSDASAPVLTLSGDAAGQNIITAKNTGGTVAATLDNTGKWAYGTIAGTYQNNELAPWGFVNTAITAAIAGTSPTMTVGVINSQAKSANAVSISGGAVYMQTADLTYPGVVSTGTQSFNGDKTFNGDLNTPFSLHVGDAAYFNKAFMGSDFAFLSSAGAQAFMTNYWGVTLWGNKQGLTFASPADVGNRDDASLVVVNSQASKANLILRQLGAGPFTGNFLELRNKDNNPYALWGADGLQLNALNLFNLGGSTGDKMLVVHPNGVVDKADITGGTGFSGSFLDLTNVPGNLMHTDNTEIVSGFKTFTNVNGYTLKNSSPSMVMFETDADAANPYYARIGLDDGDLSIRAVDTTTGTIHAEPWSISIRAPEHTIQADRYGNVHIGVDGGGRATTIGGNPYLSSLVHTGGPKMLTIENDGSVTSAAIPTSGTGGITTETDPTVPSAVKSLTNTDITHFQSAYTNIFDKDYNSLNNRPTIPTNTNQLTNGSNFAVTTAGNTFTASGNTFTNDLAVGNNAGGGTLQIFGKSASSNGYNFIQSVSASGSAYGNLILNELGGNVGVGINSPTSKFDVAGTVRLRDLATSGVPKMVVSDANGNISTQTIPSGGGATSWGGITGNLTDQTDLSNFLLVKSNISGDNNGITNVSANYTVPSDKNYVIEIGASVQATGTVTLPAASVNPGRVITIVNGNTVATSVTFSGPRVYKLSGVDAPALTSGKFITVKSINVGTGLFDWWVVSTDLY